jgi:hypothetical protein
VQRVVAQLEDTPRRFQLLVCAGDNTDAQPANTIVEVWDPKREELLCDERIAARRPLSRSPIQPLAPLEIDLAWQSVEMRPTPGQFGDKIRHRYATAAGPVMQTMLLVQARRGNRLIRQGQLCSSRA